MKMAKKTSPHNNYAIELRKCFVVPVVASPESQYWRGFQPCSAIARRIIYQNSDAIWPLRMWGDECKNQVMALHVRCVPMKWTATAQRRSWMRGPASSPASRSSH